MIRPKHIFPSKITRDLLCIRFEITREFTILYQRRNMNWYFFFVIKFLIKHIIQACEFFFLKGGSISK